MAKVLLRIAQVGATRLRRRRTDARQRSACEHDAGKRLPSVASVIVARPRSAKLGRRRPSPRHESLRKLLRSESMLACVRSEFESSRAVRNVNSSDNSRSSAQPVPRNYDFKRRSASQSASRLSADERWSFVKPKQRNADFRLPKAKPR